MKNSNKSKTLAIVLIITMLLSLSACGGSKPADVLDKIERAYNDKDIYGLVQCYDPSLQKMAEGLIGLAGGLFGFDANSVIKMLPFASKMLGNSSLLNESDWGKCKLKEISSEINGENATITYSVSIEFPDGSITEFEDTGKLIKVDGEWYISAFQ